VEIAKLKDFADQAIAAHGNGPGAMEPANLRSGGAAEGAKPCSALPNQTGKTLSHEVSMS
jgi:hypothetical protein